MTPARYTSDEVVERGRERYERDIRQHVEPTYNGRLLALDIQTGAYEIGDTGVDAAERLKARHPDAVIFLVRVGHPTAFKMGGPMRIKR